MISQLLKRFWNDESGSPLVEYSMIATLIAVLLVGTFASVGDGLLALFNGNEESIGGAINNALGS